MNEPKAKVDLDELAELLSGCEHHEDGYGLARRYIPRLIAELRELRAARDAESDARLSKETT